MAYTFYENDNRVIRYAEALAELGHEVDVIALRRRGQPKTGTLHGVAVHRIQYRSVTEKQAATYLAKILWFWLQSLVVLSVLHLRKRYDVVHVHNVPDFLVFSAVLAKLTGARTILDIHDVLPELFAGKFGGTERSPVFRTLLAVERRSCAFADHVIVANHLWEDKLVRRSVQAAKCTTFMNYPDLRLFKPQEVVSSRQREPFVILYPGSLNHHQGLDIAVRAFSLVKGRMPGAELHIYGDGPERPRLAELIRESHADGRVKLLEKLPLSEIATVMAAAAVGVVPKRASGFGNEAFSTKILEFMACGVPVIVSRTEVDSHYFNDTLVRFVESEDEAGLATAFLEVYEGRATLSAWIERAREFAVAHGWQQRVVDYRALIASLVDRGNSRR